MKLTEVTNEVLKFHLEWTFIPNTIFTLPKTLTTQMESSLHWRHLPSSPRTFPKCQAQRGYSHFRPKEQQYFGMCQSPPPVQPPAAWSGLPASLTQHQGNECSFQNHEDAWCWTLAATWSLKHQFMEKSCSTSAKPKQPHFCQSSVGELFPTVDTPLTL